MSYSVTTGLMKTAKNIFVVFVPQAAGVLLATITGYQQLAPDPVTGAILGAVAYFIKNWLENRN